MFFASEDEAELARLIDTNFPRAALSTQIPTEVSCGQSILAARFVAGKACLTWLKQSTGFEWGSGGGRPSRGRSPNDHLRTHRTPVNGASDTDARGAHRGAKAAWDKAIRLERGVDKGWLHYISTTASRPLSASLVMELLEQRAHLDRRHFARIRHDRCDRVALAVDPPGEDGRRRRASALLRVVHGDIVHSSTATLHKLFMLHGANPIRPAIKAPTKCTDLDGQLPAIAEPNGSQTRGRKVCLVGS
jgi:hypothetical protein